MKKNKIIQGSYFTIGMLMFITYLLDTRLCFLSDFFQGFFCSFSLILIISSMYFLSSNERLEKACMEKHDERLIMIRNKSFYISFYIVSFIAILICIILGIVDTKYSYIILSLSTMIIAYSFVSLIVKIILSKKL